MSVPPFKISDDWVVNFIYFTWLDFIPEKFQSIRSKPEQNIKHSVDYIMRKVSVKVTRAARERVTTHLLASSSSWSASSSMQWKQQAGNRWDGCLDEWKMLDGVGVCLLFSVSFMEWSWTLRYGIFFVSTFPSILNGDFLYTGRAVL